MLSGLLLVLASAVYAEPQGWITGKLLDPADAGIAGEVRVVDSAMKTVVLRLRAADSDVFQTTALPAGKYLLAGWAPGFRRRELPDVVVKAGHETALGVITLELGGCDAAGLTCNTIGPTSSAERVLVFGNIRLTVGCGVRLDKAHKVSCSGLSTHDIRLVREGGALQLATPATGGLSAIYPAGAQCTGVSFSRQALPVLGLGPGVDFCVRTGRDTVAHVYFTSDVEHASIEVSLWYVTRPLQRR